jgi:hypothetical protein
MQAADDVEPLPAVVLPGAQVLQLLNMSAGLPADHVPGPHSPQNRPAKPGLQPAGSTETTE